MGEYKDITLDRNRALISAISSTYGEIDREYKVSALGADMSFYDNSLAQSMRSI